MDGGGLWCFKPQRFLRWLRSRQQRRARAVPRGVCEAFTEVRSHIERGQTRDFIADPVWWHPGEGLASDASSTVGWGVVVGHVVFYGRWAPESLEAFAAVAAKQGKRDQWEEAGSAERAGTVGDAGEAVGDRDAERGEHGVWSISPAELLVTAFAVQALRECEGELPGGGPANGQFYSRCDDESAVRVVNAGRARSTSMTEAMWVVREQEIGGPGDRRMRIRLEHIRTEVSKVADLLSRGDVEEAKEVVRSRCGGRCEVRTLDEGFVREMERRVREATLEEYKGWE